MALAGHTDTWNTSSHSPFLSLGFYLTSFSSHRCSVSLLPGPLMPCPLPALGLVCMPKSLVVLIGGESLYFCPICHSIFLLFATSAWTAQSPHFPMWMPISFFPSIFILFFNHSSCNNFLYLMWEFLLLVFLVSLCKALTMSRFQEKKIQLLIKRGNI